MHIRRFFGQVQTKVLVSQYYKRKYVVDWFSVVNFIRDSSLKLNEYRLEVKGSISVLPVACEYHR